MKKSTLVNILMFFALLSLLSFFVVTKELLYPFFVPKVLFFRSVIILALPFYVYLLILDKEARPNLKNPLNILVIVFFILSLLSGFLGINSLRSFWGNYERMAGNFQLLHFVLLYFYVLTIAKCSENYLELILKSLVWISALTSLYAVFEKLGMTPWVPDESLPLRASSIFGNPIFFASFVILPLALSIFFTFQNSGKWRNIYFVLAILQIVGIILSGTRGALVGMFIGGLVALGFYFYNFKTLQKPALYAAVALVIAVLGFWAVSSKLPNNSLAKRLFTFQDSNGQARLIQWGIALKGYTERPVLGVGPENYYYIANKYFDRRLYTYDYSWFDKPHNYWLEILTTGGALGLLSYLGIIILAGLGIKKAVKNEIISAALGSALLFGLVAYQVQNLFVFDTPSAGVTFFIFLSLAGFFWEGGFLEQNQKLKTKKLPAYGLPVFGILLIGSLYIFVVTDVVTMSVTKDINYGYAIDIKDPLLAKSYFDQAQTRSFIYDRGELATKMEEFTVRAVQDSNKKDDTVFINSLFDDSINEIKLTTDTIKTNPIYWFKLGNMYSQKAYFNKSGFDLRAEEAINKSIALVPNRIEPLFFLVQLAALKNDLPNVVKISEQIVQMVPNNAEAVWRLALSYKDGGNRAKAAETAEKAQSMGYQFKLVREFSWLINYYADAGNFQKVVDLYEKAIVINPTDYQLYASLATAYVKVGETQKAINAAHKVLELNPGSKPTVDAFLKQLGAQ